jgi:hypothetical protein
MADGPTAQAWTEFDSLVEASSLNPPWSGAGPRQSFKPDFELLELLLAVPIRRGLGTQSGMPAKAVDVWVAHELRRAGFEADEVWPRATAPRVLPREVAMLREFSGMLQISRDLFERIDADKVKGGVTSTDAKILGKAYEKQVDVVIAQWSRGPELMISTKRMDSSFGKNALNRIEESYGDAKNLRGRHPLAATGFLFVMRSTAFDKEHDTALRLMDLLGKLAQEPDAYDATGILITEWTNPVSGATVTQEIEGNESIEVKVSIRHDLIPDYLDPARFMHRMVDAVLDRTPIDLHKDARRLRGEEVPDHLVDDDAPQV